MREILTYQVGGAGLCVGDGFWDYISYEHGVNKSSGQFCGSSPLQSERLNVFFNQTSRQTYYGRTILVDTNGLNDDIRCLPLYRPNNIVTGNQSAANNFAKGYYTEGSLLLEKILEQTRKEIEFVDCLQGFNIIHSIGGGTGSGLTSLLMESIDEYFPSYITSNYVIVPPADVHNTIVEPYNALLSMPSLMNFSKLTFVLDNEALTNIFLNRLRLPTASYADMNHIIALTISGATACLRFPGQLNSGLRKIFVNMVPFPNMHFFVNSLAPMNTMKQMSYNKGSINEIVQCMFSENSLLCAVNTKEGKILTASAIFRGNNISPWQIDQSMSKFIACHDDSFVGWIPNNIKTAICDIAPRGLQLSATFIANLTSICDLFHRISQKAEIMLQKKAYLYWYYSEGIEDQDFADAKEAVMQICDDYQTTDIPDE